MDETALIERYLRDLGAPRADVTLGIGDDAAIVRADPESELVLTTDALLEGVHFLPGAPARSLGHRAMAVNLSDVAAMGAEPTWALLSLNLPAADESWLREFAEGFGAIARAQGVALIGGNLARGALSITVQLTGQAPRGQALRRDGARPGDGLFVSGCVGDAAAGVQLLFAERDGRPINLDREAAQYLRARFEYPSARTALGLALRGLASACIDVSDGLYVDASRLLRASQCAARLDIASLPLSPALRRWQGGNAWQGGLAGGEDYELCFTAPAAHWDAIDVAARRTGQPVTRIGTVEAGDGLTLESAGAVIRFSPSGWDHFGR